MGQGITNLTIDKSPLVASLRLVGFQAFSAVFSSTFSRVKSIIFGLALFDRLLASRLGFFDMLACKREKNYLY